jgi:hypothetical protein
MIIKFGSNIELYENINESNILNKGSLEMFKFAVRRASDNEVQLLFEKIARNPLIRSRVSQVIRKDKDLAKKVKNELDKRSTGKNEAHIVSISEKRNILIKSLETAYSKSPKAREEIDRTGKKAREEISSNINETWSTTQTVLLTLLYALILSIITPLLIILAIAGWPEWIVSLILLVYMYAGASWISNNSL